MAIDSVLNPAGIAKKLSVAQLQKAIQDGVIPPYVGIPVLQEKVQMEQRMRNAAAQPQQNQPTVAQQVMSQAQGLDSMPSNLPTEYAGGGIVAFARGGLPDVENDTFDDEDEEDFQKELDALMSQMDDYGRRMSELRSMESGSASGLESLPAGMPSTGMTKQEAMQSLSVKEGSQPPKTIERTEKRVTKPAGLEELLELVKQKESGGSRYDSSGRLLTSPKGAMGEMQVMPGTARDPGFGIAPAREGDAEDLARVGREYYAKMLERYGDPKIAAIAYNWGPGNTDKWLMAGADPSKLPGETRQYSQGFANGGAVKRFQYGGISGTMPFNLAELGLDDLTRMAKMGDPAALEELEKRRITSTDPFKRSAEALERSKMPRMAGTPAATPASAASPAAADVVPEAAAKRGMGLMGRIAGPLGIATLGYDVGKNILERKQGEELSKYGPEPEPTADELERASRPAFMKDVSMSPRDQQERGIKPLAPLTYTPAGVQTYGPRPGYTPPSPAGTRMPGTTVGENFPTGFEDFIKQVPGEDISANLAQEDIDRAAGMQGLKSLIPEPAAVQAAVSPDSEFLKRLQERISKGYAKLDKQEESDKYLALLSAGLGIMSGTSPFGLSNIGRGGMMGVQSLMQSDAARAAQESKLMNAELLAERIRTYGESAKEAREARKLIAADREAGLKQRAESVEEGRAEGRRIRYGQIAAQMEKSYLDRAENTARATIKSNPELQFDEAKATAFIESAKSAARNKLSQNPLYRRYVREATEGFDPGQIDVDSDINDLLTKYLKPKK